VGPRKSSSLLAFIFVGPWGWPPPAVVPGALLPFLALLCRGVGSAACCGHGALDCFEGAGTRLGFAFVFCNLGVGRRLGRGGDGHAGERGGGPVVLARRQVRVVAGLDASAGGDGGGAGIDVLRGGPAGRPFAAPERLLDRHLFAGGLFRWQCPRGPPGLEEDLRTQVRRLCALRFGRAVAVGELRNGNRRGVYLDVGLGRAFHFAGIFRIVVRVALIVQA